MFRLLGFGCNNYDSFAAITTTMITPPIRGSAVQEFQP